MTESDIDDQTDHQTDFGDIDFFTSPTFVPDPQPYFEYLRGQGPVVKEAHHGVVAVTGYLDTLEVFKDAGLWSNCVAVGGPFPPLPFTPEGDDISELIEAHRTQMPLHEHMVAMDPPNHTRARSILSRLLTPSRLKGQSGNSCGSRDRQLPPSPETVKNANFFYRVLEAVPAVAIADCLAIPARTKELLCRAGANPAP